MTPNGLVGKGDAYAQALHAFRTIEAALKQAGASMADVVRTRMYVTEIGRWKDVTKAHAEFFAPVRPAATLVEVKGLVDPDMLVEIEVEAYVQQLSPARRAPKQTSKKKGRRKSRG
jgi:enamine deaminase RidA (YjgF/YER057c/UK114 family)